MTENVFVQDDSNVPGQRVDWSAAHGAPAADPRALSHVIQFYRASAAAQQVQELTAASVRNAQARASSPVKLLAVPLEGEEADCVPQGFCPTAPLRRTIADLHPFQIPRRFPLLFDILDLAAAHADPAGYLIFTNSDICLTPDFYDSVRAFLQAGFDSVIINRRTVGNLNEYGSRPELAMPDVGIKHRGFDCFVFPTAWVARFLKTESCVGIAAVMRPLLYNLVALADRLLIGRALHLTYHYGNDLNWRSPEFSEYQKGNEGQMQYALMELCRHPRQFERLQAFCKTNGEPYCPGIATPPPSSAEMK